jgi:pilus assembly protein CpaB
MAERRYSALLYTAVATAILATFGVYRVLQATKAKSQVVTRPVIVASKNLSEGTLLSPSNVEVKQYPVGTIPAEALTKMDSVNGRVTRIEVFKGEVIVNGRLAPPGTGPGLQARLGPGKRAAGIRITDVSGLSGLIPPDSRVDVLVTMAKNEATSHSQAKTFMQNMRVLSIGTKTQDSEGKPIKATVATLEVTPEEAEQLAVAEKEGFLQLVLRGYGDSTTVKTKGADARDVLAKFDIPAAPKPDKPKTKVVEKKKDTVEKKVEVPTSPPPVVVPPAPPKKAKPESTAVIIHRGSKTDKAKFQKDTIKKDSTKTPPDTTNRPAAPAR